MPSIIPGYEYDIFISYRQNDNKKDGWVTEFAKALQNELDATVKERISIYFDENPYDGIAETHDVDDSLAKKLKCLIFMPIISKTYCDPSSFAWTNEFLTFRRIAESDEYGLKVDLRSGNTASRILLIRIHDIDDEDAQLIENEIGGVMRPVDFIYRETGVNRPLKPSDDRSLNLNNTDYSNQVNKIANAIKDLIQALKAAAINSNSDFTDPQKERIKELRKIGISHSKKNKLRLILGFAILAIAIAAYFLYPRETPAQENVVTLEKSIAVLPFEDMSPNKDQEYLGDGIAEEILNVLAQVKGLKVIGRTSSFSYKGKNTDLITIGEELGVATVLEGSVRKDGNLVKITAQFINTKDGSHLWSWSRTRELSNIFALQEELADSISRTLLISLNVFGNETQQPKSVNEEAYNYYLLGKYYRSLTNTMVGDKEAEGKVALYQSLDMFKKALELDDQFAAAYVELSNLYNHFGFLFGNEEIPNVWDLAETTVKKALQLAPNNSEALRIQGYILRNRYWDWEGARRYYQKSLDASPNNVNTLNAYSLLLCATNQLDSALFYSKKAMELDGSSGSTQTGLARTYYYSRQYDQAQSIIEKYDLEENAAGLSFMVRILFHTDKDRAVETLLTKSYSELDTERLREIYKGMGWNSFMQTLYKEATESGRELSRTLYSQAAPIDDIIALLNEDANNKVGGLVYLLVEPLYDPVRSDPRFVELVKRMGLDQY